MIARISMVFVFVAFGAGGCTAATASPECVSAWEASPEAGEACESGASIEALDAEPTPETSITAPRDASTGLSTGRRQH